MKFFRRRPDPLLERAGPPRIVHTLTVLAATGCYAPPQFVDVRFVMLDPDSLCLYTPIRWGRSEVYP